MKGHGELLRFGAMWQDESPCWEARQFIGEGSASVVVETPTCWRCQKYGMTTTNCSSCGLELAWACGWALCAVNDSQKSGLSKLFGAREVIIEYHVMGLTGFNLQCWMLVLLWFNCNCPGSSLLEYEICNLLLILQKPTIEILWIFKERLNILKSLNLYTVEI